MGDLMANVLLRLCLAVLVVACVQSETDESDSQVQLLSDAAEANTLVVLLDEGKGKGKGKGKLNKGAALASHLVKKIAKGFKLKGTEKVTFAALTKKSKAAGKNAKKYKKQGSTTLKTIKQQEDVMRVAILNAQGIPQKAKKWNKKGKKGKKKDKKKAVKERAKAEIQKGAEAGKAAGAAAGKMAAIKAAKVYIKGLKKAGKKPTAAHEQSMIEAAAKAGEVAGKAKGGQKAMAA